MASKESIIVAKESEPEEIDKMEILELIKKQKPFDYDEFRDELIKLDKYMCKECREMRYKDTLCFMCNACNFIPFDQDEPCCKCNEGRWDPYESDND